MFKYISTILSQFTAAQRIIALIILVVSIVIITLGPSFISAITLDRGELIEDLGRKENRIEDLERRIDTLSNRLIANQRNCTDMITSREEEFIRMLDKLRSELQNPYRSTHSMMVDSGPAPTSSGPKPKIIQIPESSSNGKAIQMIDEMKQHYKNHK